MSSVIYFKFFSGADLAKSSHEDMIVVQWLSLTAVLHTKKKPDDKRYVFNREQLSVVVSWLRNSEYNMYKEQ